MEYQAEWAESQHYRAIEDHNKTSKQQGQQYQAIWWSACIDWKGDCERIVKFQVFAAVTMKYAVFWDVTPCGSYKNSCFARMYCLHHQGGKINEVVVMLQVSSGIVVLCNQPYFEPTFQRMYCLHLQGSLG
jgi:hypothetical protein